MAYKKKSSPIGLFIVLILLFLGGVAIALTSGAAQRKQQTKSKADVNPITLSFSPGAVTNGVTPLTLNATSNIGVAFAEIDITFDNTKIQLANEITRSSKLTIMDKKTPMATANSTGKIQILLGVDPDVSPIPPTGTFDLALLPFKYVSTPVTTTVDIDTTKTYFNDLTSATMGYTSTSYTFNQVASTATPTTVVNATSTPTTRPTNTPSTRPTNTPTSTPATHPTATPMSTTVCWNYAINYNGQVSWPNGCKGTPNPPGACTQVVVPLTSAELTQYNAWVTAGKPSIPGCTVTATATPTRTPTNTPTTRPTATLTPVPTVPGSPTHTPTPRPTATPRPVATATQGTTEVTCTCGHPGGISPQNDYSCTDGTNTYCELTEMCTTSAIKPGRPCQTAEPTPTTSVVPNPPQWWFVIPAPLRNFLEQLYVWVFFFRQPSTQTNLLEGLPTPTPTP